LNILVKSFDVDENISLEIGEVTSQITNIQADFNTIKGSFLAIHEGIINKNLTLFTGNKISKAKERQHEVL